MEAPIKLVKDEGKAYNGPPLSPRSLAINTLASLPRPVNPAEVAVKVVQTPTLYTEEAVKAFAAKHRFFHNIWDENLIIECPGVDERVFRARPVDSPDPHFFYMFNYVI